MTIGSETTGAGEAPRPEETEPAYEGGPGRTRLEPVHVPLSNGFVRTVQVYVAVNVATDPQLREPALAGALHRFETGEALAVPFVYHDPEARKLALVVPEVLRHEELRLRARLLTELADEPGSAVPRYAREAVTVIGPAGLRGYLERVEEASEAPREPEQRPHGQQRAHDLDVQADAIAQREARLQVRAEEVTRREDELRAYAEQLEAVGAELAARDRQLKAREDALRRRSSDGSGSGSLPLVPEDDVVQLVDDEVEEVDEVDEVEELHELEPLRTDVGARPEPSRLEDEVELVDEPRTEGFAAADDVEEIVEDVEELEEIEPIGDVTGVHAEIPGAGGLAAEEATSLLDEVPRAAPAKDGAKPSVAPPSAFLQRRHGPFAQAVVEAGSVRLFVRLPEGKSDLVDGAPPDLLAQLVVIEACPVVLLSLVERGQGRPTILRAALDPRSADDRAVLESLRRRFVARVSLFTSDGRYLRSLEVAAGREVNTARILDRVAKLRSTSAVDVATAKERVLSAPPPVRAKNHPFVPPSEIEPPADAAGARKQLERLAQWSTQEKMDHALLVLSVPRDVVDASARTILGYAVEHGLCLPERLLERAVSLGLGPDVPTLVHQQIEAFARTTRSPDRGGLSPEQIADGWERLLEAAAENEVATDTDTHELAWQRIREVRGGDDDLAGIDRSKHPEMGVPELVMLLEHPRYRRDAAIEIAKREDPQMAETLSKVARKMPRAEVVRLVPRITALGEDAGDALIDGLDARKTFVRQAFALALGHLELRRAVVPLLHLLLSEQSEVWREVARVIGGFGTASLRTVTRQLRDPKGKPERLVLTLAHLANHGCLDRVEKLTKDERPAVAAMASEALTLRKQASMIEDQVLGATPLTEDDPILKFSRRFYEELEGKAPEQDLEEV